MPSPRLTDQISIKQEPRGLYGRFYLATEQALADAGLSVRMQPLDTLWRQYERQPETWNGLAPVLDTRICPVPPEEAMCHFIYDRHGEVAACNATRLIDLGDQTLKEACEDLTFFYGPHAPQWRGQHRCTLTAPVAARMRGRISYAGGMWVRPDYRHSGLLTHIMWLCRLYGPSQWKCDWDLGIGRASAFSRADVQAMYDYEHFETAISFYVDDKAIMHDGMILVASMARVHKSLAERAAVVAPRLHDGRRDQQRVASA